MSLSPINLHFLGDSRINDYGEKGRIPEKVFNRHPRRYKKGPIWAHGLISPLLPP
jgi:hypothetical protein